MQNKLRDKLESAALRLDAFFGYFVPGTFEVGYARGLIERGTNETWFLLTGSL